MKQKRKKIKVRVGDVCIIPLPNGKFAFGRVFRDYCLAVYKKVSDSPHDLPFTEEYQFVVAIYDDILNTGFWSIIANRPFSNEEEEWPPPMCIKDRIQGGYSIYYKGEINKSTKEECQGLETVAVWAANHIVDRIMGDTVWHRDF